jgi:hypothetical protein
VTQAVDSSSDSPSSGQAQRRYGAKSVYRGKRRDLAVVITLTDQGLADLAWGVESSGLSKPDYIERLIRRAREQAQS